MSQAQGLFSNIRQDLPASIVVFFVAVPLCLGIALASGAPLFSGLIAGIVGGIIVGLLSDSSLGVSGPAAGLAVIVLTSIQSLGSFEIFLVSVVLAGIFQIIMGLLKGGVIGYYFPSSVIKGMLTGIGVIIILKQIPHAFGYDKDYEGDLAFSQVDGQNTLTELINMFDYISMGAVIVSLISLAILITWDVYLSKKHKAFKIIPGPLIAVSAGIAYNLITKSYFPGIAIQAEHLVQVPVAENFMGFIGQFSFPDFGHVLNSEVWVVGMTIAIVASLETLLSVEATDKLDPKKGVTNTNRELLAQGGGNIISGLLGGIPVTQVIVRSSANIQSGGQSKLSAILHGIFLLVCVAITPMVLNMIPLAVLACILFVVGFKLAKPSLFKEMYQLGWAQFIPFFVTILGVVFTDLLEGISIGVLVALVILLKNSFKNSHFLHQETTDAGRHKIKMTLAEEVSFLNKGAILKALNGLPEGTHLTIDMSNSVHIDYDVSEIISNYRDTSESKGVDVHITGLNASNDYGNILQTADY